MFGNSYRLELLAAINATQGPFHARELAARMDVADNLVITQLKRLVALGLLTRHVRGPQVMYTRSPSALWAAAEEVCAELGGGY